MKSVAMSAHVVVMPAHQTTTGRTALRRNEATTASQQLDYAPATTNGSHRNPAV